MAAWAVLTWLAGLGLLAPASSAILGWHLQRVEQGIVGNDDLVSWLLTPMGISYLWAFGTLGLLLTVVRFAGYFWIWENAREGRGIGMVDLFMRATRRLPRLIRLCGTAVLLGWAALVPVVLALWLVYGFFLGEHDPNYYLAEKPAEWTHALWVAGMVLALWLCGLAALGMRLFLALPVYLHERCSVRAALSKSYRSTQGQTKLWGCRFAAVIGSWLLARFTVNSVFLLVGVIALGWIAEVSSFLTPLIFSTALFLGFSFLLDWVVGFLGFALLSATIAQGYFETINGTLGSAESRANQRASLLPKRRALSQGKLWLRPRFVFLSVAVLASGSLAFSIWFFDHSPPVRSITVAAHRAGPAPAPENTLAALEAAVEAGADIAEIDVLMTRDGEVVVTHDADLMREAGDPRRIAETPYTALRDVVKRTKADIPEKERRLETLASFLQRADDRIGLIIELKYYGANPRLVRAVVEILQRHKGSAEVRVMSLDLAAVRELRRRLPDYRVGYVSTVAIGAVTAIDVDFLALAQNRITPKVIREAHKRGVEIYAWTPNQIDQIADLVQMGIDGIITDYPGRARAVEAGINQMSPVENFLLRFNRRLLEIGEDTGEGSTAAPQDS